MSDDENTDNVNILCERWILEFDCHKLWADFQKDGAVEYFVKRYNDQPYCRSLGDGQSSHADVRICHKFRCLIYFMCRISDAIKAAAKAPNIPSPASKSTPGLTVLEEAIDIFEHLIRAYESTIDSTLLQETKLFLRRQAVLTCYQAGNEAQAREVFNRQWGHWVNSEEMKMRDKLAAILDGRKKSSESLHSLVAKCSEFLQSVFDQLQAPFLTQAARTIFAKTADKQTASAQKNPENGTESPVKSPIAPHAVVETPSSKSVALSSNSSSSPVLLLSRVQSPIKRPAAIHVAKNSPSKPSTSKPRSASPSHVSKNSPSKPSTSKPRSASPSHVSKNSPSKPSTSKPRSASPSPVRKDSTADDTVSEMDTVSENNDSTDDAASDIDINASNSTCGKRKCPRGVSGGVGRHRGLRAPWNALEEEVIYKGVKKYGVGNWQAIAKNLLAHRTNVDIKDKWRTMTRQGRVQELANKFGPLL